MRSPASPKAGRRTALRLPTPPDQPSSRPFLNDGRGAQQPPGQPAAWPFIEDWLAPLHGRPLRWPRRAVRPGEVSLAAGLTVESEGPDPDRRLETAVADFRQFLASAGLPPGGPYSLRLRREPRLAPESFRLDVGETGAALAASDPDGIRRGLVWIEDEMARREGPVLPRGVTRRAPVIRDRIQMELGLFRHLGLDTYPDAFLNRLAHLGVNGLMVPLEGLYPHRLVPEFERPPEPLFQALRERVRRYARYGIKVYLYLNEPRAFPAGSPLPARYPDLAGHESWQATCYCTGSPRGRRFLEQAFERLAAGAPGLGGLIVICVGERTTHCYSGWGVKDVKPIHCPRCASREPASVLRGTLAAMERGLRRGAPRARLIAWPYSSYILWGERQTRAAAGAAFPPRVVMMHNFESAGTVRQRGRIQRADDYWLTYPGPSALFRDCARAARRRGTDVYAKLMVGCSHELASVPYLPAPGLVYAKLMAARRLGVTGFLANWGSGNDPSLMNKAAGELAFEPAPAGEAAFLRSLAGLSWGRQAGAVARIWRRFARALAHVPVNIGFSYYGPLHNGPAWPLCLEPRNEPLAGNWRNELPLGDRIGDCTGFQPLDELIALCARLAREWRRGLRAFEALAPAARGNPERLEQLAVARALDAQFESGWNILRFYRLREDLLRGGAPARAALPGLQALLRREQAVSRRLLALAEAHPRLGFCPEAAAYKYFPALLRWRIEQVRRELRQVFPRVARAVRAGRPVRTRSAHPGFVYECRRLPRAPGARDTPPGGLWTALPEAPPFYCQHPTERTTRWKAGHDGRSLVLAFECREPQPDRLVARGEDRGELSGDDQVCIVLQTSPFEPFHRFFVNARGAREYSYRRGLNVMPHPEGREWVRAMHADRYYRWTARTYRGADGWGLVVRIPFRSLNWAGHPGDSLAFTLFRQAGPAAAREISQWARPVTRPWIERHPANFGRLVLASE